MERIPKGIYTLEFRAEAVKLVEEEGLSVDAAAQTLHRLLAQARQRQLTGVGLKDDADQQFIGAEAATPETNRPALWRPGATVPDGKR